MNEIINENELKELEQLKKTLLEIQKSMKGVNAISKETNDSLSKIATLSKSFSEVCTGLDKIKKSLSDVAKESTTISNTYNIEIKKVETVFDKLFGKVKDKTNEIAETIKSGLEKLNDVKVTETANTTLKVEETGIENIDIGFDLSKLLTLSNISAAASVVSSLIPLIKEGISLLTDLPDYIKEANAELNAQLSSWNEINNSRLDNLGSLEYETRLYSALSEELKQISEMSEIDSASMERAQEIIAKLNKDLGTSIAITEDGKITFDEYADSIEKAIMKKEALARLDSLEVGYQEAKNHQYALYNELLADKEVLTAKNNELKEAQAVLDSMRGMEGSEYYRQYVAQLAAEIQSLQDNYDSKKVLFDQENQLIKTYEDLEIAIYTDNYEAIGEITQNMDSTLKRASNATYEELDNQYALYSNKYKDVIKDSKSMTEMEGDLLRESLLQSTEELMKSMADNGTLTTDAIREILEQMGITSIEEGSKLQAVLSELGDSSEVISKENAKLVIDGIVEGIDENIGNAYDRYEFLAMEPGFIFEDINEIHSPSKRFSRYGNYLVEGLNSGILDTMDATSATFDEWNSVISSWQDNMQLPHIETEVSYYTPYNSVLASAMKFLNLPGFPKVKFNKYGLGGIPDVGEIFVAREAGPELVGMIGNSSAVMNNDQIVKSVSDGVARAVQSVMSPDMLRNIIYNAMDHALKENTADITMKVGETQFAKVAVKSINALKRRQGRVYLDI